MVGSVEQWLNGRSTDDSTGGRIRSGTVVGEWRVIVFVGAGLSAEVYRVMNVRTRIEGALKLLTDGTRGLKERFMSEVDAIRFLSLPALPRFLGSGEYDGSPYYVMEYLQPLDQLSPREVPRFIIRVAKAVQMLHDAGYVHRDIKPANILRRRNGEPVLIDLGLLKKRGIGVTDSVVRYGRNISIIDGRPVGVGTLDYAAPEQLLKGECSVQSDVFSLGKLLRAFYHGQVPFNLKSVVRKATREQPKDRFLTAYEFASAVRHRNRTLKAALVVVFLLIVATVTYPQWKGRLYRIVVPVVKPPVEQRMPLVQKPDEADTDYLTRMLAMAEAGNVDAQVNVAESYFYGRGTATNREAAVIWYVRAAEAGNSSAQASLGLCCFRGWGCVRDYAESVRWYMKAAEQGNLVAMNDLAFCYMHGYGVEKDETRGFEWAMKAAERGNPPAQTMVGECYLDGRGVERNIERAETWLYRAARQGNRRAQTLLRAR